MLQSGTKKGQVKKENKPQHTRGEEEYTMNEQILMKLAEAEKKQSIKQKLKDNAWTIGLSPIAPSVGFAIDQQRANIKKEKATDEKPKSFIERRPGVVGGVVAGGLISPLARMAANNMKGIRTSPAQLASEMVRGAAGGAIGGVLLVDPLTRWGTKRYYRKKDEKALKKQQRNELLAKRLAENEILRQAQVRQAERYLQENPLQKTAAYGDTIKNLAGRVEGGARNAFQKLRNTPYGDTVKNLASRVESGAQNAFQKLRNTSGAFKPLQQQNLARSVSQFAQRNAKALTTGAIGLGAAGAVAGGIAAARAIKNKRQGQEKTASYYAARELLGLQKEAKETSAKDQILKIIRDLA
jgi:hypothetical protein